MEYEFEPKPHNPRPGIFRDVETGEEIPVAGYGSMPEMQALLEGGIDWLPPIYEQVALLDGSFQPDAVDDLANKRAA